MCARREKGTAVCREEHRRTDRELSGFPLSPHIIALLEYSLTLSTPQTNTLKIHSLSPYAFAFAAPKLHYCLFAFVPSYY
jgi:hypothetical protein